MKVDLFNCARNKLNNNNSALSPLPSDLIRGSTRKSIIFKKLIVVIGVGLSIGVGEAKAATYSGTLAADSPSFPATPNLHYKAYTLKGQTGVTYTLGIPESVTAYSYKNYFDPTDMVANTKTDLFDGDAITGTSHY